MVNIMNTLWINLSSSRFSALKSLSLLTAFLTSSLICPTSVANDSASNISDTTKIYGGITADNSEWPFMVALVRPAFDNYFGQYCGATIIDPNWVLTAAHCVSGASAPMPTSEVEVLTQVTNLRAEVGTRIQVSEIIVHPDYINGNVNGDIALIKLASPASIPAVRIIDDISDLDQPGTRTGILGWGSTSNQSSSPSFPDQLQEAVVDVVSQENCQQSSSFTDKMICAGINSSIDSCVGDSGGPLIAWDPSIGKWKQSGIVSWGPTDGNLTCALPDRYGAYTRLTSYSSFIQDNVCSAQPAIPAPDIQLSVNGNEVTATWPQTPGVEGYELYYQDALLLTKATVNFTGNDGSIDVGLTNSLTATVPSGSAYNVWMRAYRGNCMSPHGLGQHFSIN